MQIKDSSLQSALNKLLWFIVVAICGFGVSLLKEMNASITELNANMIKVLIQMDNTNKQILGLEKRLDKDEDRLERLER